jgi:hypothetical protein
MARPYFFRDRLPPSATGQYFSFVGPYFRISPCIDAGMKMTKAFVTAVIILALLPSAAFAQHRADAAAVGALSGAVVLGPVGALVGAAAGAAAGALVGYFSEPSMAHSSELTGSQSMRHRRHKSRDANRVAPPAVLAGATAASESKASMHRTEGPRVTAIPSSVNGATPTAKPQPVSTGGLPPVQALE